MSLEERLADELIRKHPERAAVALELTGLDEAGRAAARGQVEDVAAILRRMSPAFAAGVLERMDAERVAALMDALPVDVAARLLRRIDAELAAAALAASSVRRARALRSLMRFEEGSAGTLMDPEVLALPETLTAREALDRIRESPQTARYNVYVLDAEQKLVGVVNLRELLLARQGARLADFMVRDPEHLHAADDRAAVVRHPGWRGVHSLPVVDDAGAYLGAVRYRTLRALEDEMLAVDRVDADAREALGRLFSAGAAGVLDALATRPQDGRSS